MANWLSISDFVDDVQLTNSSITSVASGFDSFLGRYEVKFLRELLGVALYNAMIAGLAVTPTPDVKWTNLKNGCDFVYSDGLTYHFSGLKEALKYFCYVEYQKMKSSTNVVFSNVSKKSDIAIPIEPISPLVLAQNKCVDLIEEAKCFIEFKPTDYENFVFGAVYHNRANILGI